VVNGETLVGGVLGCNYYDGEISSCVALNPNIKGTTTSVNRVIGDRQTFSPKVVSGNAAFVDMKRNGEVTEWGNKG